MRVAFTLGILASLVGLVTSSFGSATAKSGPPPGLTVYGKTLWNLDALLHDTFGERTVCLRVRDEDFVSTNCGGLQEYAYWKDVYVAARHSRFRLVRLAKAPALGNVMPVRVNGFYVSCGRFPVAFSSIATLGNPSHRWLVTLHGWAMPPFTCL